MPIPDEIIEGWELKYGVDITYIPEEGTFSVQTLKTNNPFKSIHNEHTQYAVKGRILDETITPNSDYAEALGIPLGDYPAKSFGDMYQKLFENSGGLAELNSRDPDFSSSPLHRVAIVSGALRTDGQIPPEAWAEDLSFGGSGSGANFVAGGGQGGIFSPIGIMHDVDMFLGGHGYGPMSDLANIVAENKTIPTGLHGLGHIVSRIASFSDPEKGEVLKNEQADFPETRDIPNYVTSNPDGWYAEIVVFPIDEKDRHLGPDEKPRGFKFLLPSKPTLAEEGLEKFLAEGGDMADAIESLRKTEDQYNRPTLDNVTETFQNFENTQSQGQDYEDDYGIV